MIALLDRMKLLCLDTNTVADTVETPKPPILPAQRSVCKRLARRTAKSSLDILVGVAVVLPPPQNANDSRGGSTTATPTPRLCSSPRRCDWRFSGRVGKLEVVAFSCLGPGIWARGGLSNNSNWLSGAREQTMPCRGVRGATTAENNSSGGDSQGYPRTAGADDPAERDRAGATFAARYFRRRPTWTRSFRRWRRGSWAGSTWR